MFNFGSLSLLTRYAFISICALYDANLKNCFLNVGLIFNFNIPSRQELCERLQRVMRAQQGDRKDARPP